MALNEKNSKSISQKFPKGSDLPTDSASDRVRNEKGKKKGKKMRRGEERAGRKGRRRIRGKPIKSPAENCV